MVNYLLTIPSDCLRVVARAYEATPILQPEKGVNVPPLDLYLNNRVAKFEAGLQTSGMDQTIKKFTARIANRLKRRKHRLKAQLDTHLEGGQNGLPGPIHGLELTLQIRVGKQVRSTKNQVNILASK